MATTIDLSVIVNRAIKQEIERIIEEETKDIHTKVMQKVRETIGGLAIKVADQIDISRDQRQLLIRIKDESKQP
jgi:hypothetical protein